MVNDNKQQKILMQWLQYTLNEMSYSFKKLQSLTKMKPNVNNSRNHKTLSFILEGTLKDWRGIFLVDKCLSDTFKIHIKSSMI